MKSQRRGILAFISKSNQFRSYSMYAQSHSTVLCLIRHMLCKAWMGGWIIDFENFITF